jgi:formate dehydrogenase assembly factor FdhD
MNMNHKMVSTNCCGRCAKTHAPEQWRAAYFSVTSVVEIDAKLIQSSIDRMKVG